MLHPSEKVKKIHCSVCLPVGNYVSKTAREELFVAAAAENRFAGVDQHVDAELIVGLSGVFRRFDACSSLAQKR